MKKYLPLFKRYSSLALVLALVLLVALPAGAQTPPPAGLTVNFDMQEMFSWANMMLSALMPVVYVTMGVGLAFVIIRALKSAFN